MEYKTGYFAKANKYLELGYFPVSIARFNPKGTNFMQWIRIAPAQDILSAYKSGQIDEVEYEFKYTLQLQNTDIMKDWNYLLNVISLTKKDCKGVVFLCYEKSDSFCHRHIFAEYMKTHFNIDIEELIVWQ